ncbi:TetR/AcrR family transcriptional regulator [Pendulispora albinea]|uniref:TetR/AcrR family transcriptional regulator n=1 Tax=Pendulispora albinea TaxID=2741071 RepID=A0ABZ2LTQ5_9BACT
MGTSEAERRKLILDAARRLLSHYGPHKTTIAEIAREAAIGVGSVYLEFPSKEAIIGALSELEHARILEAMERAIAKKKAKNASFADQIAAILDARVEMLLERGGEGLHTKDLLHCGNPSVKDAQTRFEQSERTLIARLLREGIEAGELEVDDADRTAAAMLRAYAAFSAPKIFWEAEHEVREMLRAVHELVKFGITRRVRRR